MSLERGSTAVLQGERKENHEEHITIPKHIATLSPEKKKSRKAEATVRFSGPLSGFIHISSHLETLIQDTHKRLRIHTAVHDFISLRIVE